MIGNNIHTNLVSVISGEAVVRAANLAAAVFIARVHGAKLLGVYVACLAVVTVVVMFADNGLQTCAITELSGSKKGRERILGQLYISKLVLTVGALLLLSAFAFKARATPLVVSIGAWVTLRMILQSFSQLQFSVLKALGRAKAIGLAQGANALMLFACVWIAFHNGWGMLKLLAWFTAGEALELSLLTATLWGLGVRCSWPAHAFFWASMRRSTPFGIAAGLANLIVRLDTIVLSALVSLSELGNFSAANNILAVVYVTAWLLGTVLLPEMVRLVDSPEQLRAYVTKCSRLIFVAGFPTALLAFWVAPRVLVVLYGAFFARAGALASIMTFACPFILLNAVYTNRFLATNSRAVFLGVFSATTFATVVLDLVFGRAFGSMGVATAIVIREVGMFLAFWALTSRVSAPATPLNYPASI